MNLDKLLHPQKQKEYQAHLKEQGMSPASIQRKSASLNKLTSWAKDKGYIKPTPPKLQPSPKRVTTGTPQPQTIIASPEPKKSFLKNLKPKHYAAFGTGFVGLAAVTIYLLRLNIPGLLDLSSSARFPNQTQTQTTKTASDALSPTQPLTATSGDATSWVIHFEGKVTSAIGEEDYTKPLNEPNDFVFKLYSNELGGAPLWISKEWNLIPDTDGNLAAPLGDISRGDIQIPYENFFAYEELFLGVSTAGGPEMSERFRVSTAATAANAYLLDKHAPKEAASEGAVPVINSSGTLTLAAAAPKISASDGILTLEGQAVTLQTPFSSDGDITLAPDGEGNINFQLENQAGDSVSLTNTNLSSGTLLSGTVASSSTGFKFLEFSGGASPSARFRVDAPGNLFFSGGLQDKNLNAPIAFSDSANTALPGTTSSILEALNLAYTTAVTANGGTVASPTPTPTATPTPTPTTTTSPWTDGGTYLYPTAYETLRIYDSTETDYLDIYHDGSNAVIDLEGGQIQIKDSVSIQNGLSADNFYVNHLNFNTQTAPTTSAGRIYFDGTDLYLYDSTSWVDLTQQGAWTLTGDDIYFNTGNIGIGDSSPDDTLDIEDSALGYNFLFGSGGITFSGATSDTFTMAADGDISLSAGSPIYGSGLTVDATNGYIGLGVSDPDEMLEISGRIHLSQETAPAVTTDKLYNTGGSLYWNGSVVSTGGAPNFDEVYAQAVLDTDLSMEIDDTSGLIYNLTTTGDFIIQDNGIAIATFGNAGNISLSGNQNAANSIELFSNVGGISLSTGNDTHPISLASGGTITLSAGTPLVKSGLTLNSSGLFVGETSETISNSGFTMNGNDVFIEDLLGVEGNIYTDGSFVAGSTLTMTDGSLTQGSGNLLLSAADAGTLTLSTGSDSGTVALASGGTITLSAGGTTNYGSGLSVDSSGNVIVGNFLDMSSLTHTTTALQGLRLPQAASFTSPSSGEGFLAWDTDDNELNVYNGSSWSTISGAWTVNGNDIYYSTGNVGIGSDTTPDAALAITNDNLGYDFLFGSSGVTLSTNTSQTITLASAGDLSLSSGSNSYASGLTLDTSGNLGLGTASPTSTLDVTKFVTASSSVTKVLGANITDNTTSTGGYSALYLNIDPSTGAGTGNKYLAELERTHTNNLSYDLFTIDQYGSTIVTQRDPANFGTGADGAITVSTTKTIDTDTIATGRSNADAVNFAISTSIAAAATTIDLGATPNGLAVGDEIIIINLRDPSNTDSAQYSDWATNIANINVGKYETKHVTAINSNTLTLDSALTNAYDGTTYTILVQRIPQYTNVTVQNGGSLTTSAFSTGTGKGGILFFRASGTVDVQSGGTITAAGKGYPVGASARTGGITYNGAGGDGANTGDGLSGQGGGGGADSTGTNGGTGAAGGGGGGGPNYRGGGGGGGYGTVGAGGEDQNGSASGASGSGNTGGNGGNVTSVDTGGGGGGTYGTADLSSRLMLGSSGGRGHFRTAGAGGGILFLSAPTLITSGTISSNGENAAGPTAGQGSGGGGSGGSVWIQAQKMTLGSSLVTADGGTAGSSSPDGGVGGDGRVKLDYTTLSGSPSPAAGSTDSSWPSVTATPTLIVDNNSNSDKLISLRSATNEKFYVDQFGSLSAVSSDNTTAPAFIFTANNITTQNVFDLDGTARTTGDFMNINTTGTTGDVFDITNTATTGDVIKVSTTATTGDLIDASVASLTTGKLLNLAVTGSQTMSGDLVSIDVDSASAGVFAGTFLKFDNDDTTSYQVDHAGRNILFGESSSPDKQINARGFDVSGDGQTTITDFDIDIDGTGADGSITLSTTKTIDTDTIAAGRSYADAANFNIATYIQAGIKTIDLGATPNGLAAGDEILIINLRDTNNIESAQYSDWATNIDNIKVGQYETALISSISSNTLTLDRNIKHDYDGTNYAVMVQRIPQYTNVTVQSGGTLTVSAFSTATGKGGVIFFRATGTVDAQSGGTITAAEKGYPGGTAAYIGGTTYNGVGGSGGGTDGSSGQGGGGGANVGSTPGSGTPGGGGGGGGYYQGGGGGGGYGTAGGGGEANGQNGSGNTGGNGGEEGAGGGGTYGTTDLSRLMLGSGGGSGPTVSQGGIGGGIVFIGASTVNVDGTISADGEDGEDDGPSGQAQGAGGSGGSLWIKANTSTLGSSLVTADGGLGGTTWNDGGDGGAGRIRLDYTTLTGTTSPTVGDENNLSTPSLLVNRSTSIGDIFGLQYAGTDKLIVNSSGQLGVGDSSPDDTLDIEDANLGYNFLFGSGGITFSGATSDTFTMAADGDISLSAGSPIYASGLTVDATNGFTGLGVSDPDEMLEINGRLHLAQTTAPGVTTDKLYNVSGSLYWNGTDIGSGGSWTVNGSDIYRASNVGIGADTTPDSALAITDDNLGYDFLFGSSGMTLSGAGTDNFTLASGGTISLSAGTGQTQTSGLTLDSNGYVQATRIQAHSADGLALYDDGGNGLFIEDGGNIGIGTTSPTNFLHVANSWSSTTEPLVYLHNTKTGLDNAGAVLKIANSRSDTDVALIQAETFYVMDGGKVGVGMNTLTEQFQVAGSGALYIHNGDPYLKFYTSSGGSGAEIQADRTDSPSSGATDLYLKTSASSGATPTTKMTITSTGTVGIGDTSPNALLDLESSTAEHLRLTYDEDNYTSLAVASTGGVTLSTAATGGVTVTSVGDISLSAGSGFSYASGLTVDATNGYVGIGDSTPSYLLELAQDSAGKPTSNTWTVVSDERLKKNIQNFTDGLETINNIETVSYQLNGKASTPNGARGIGVIAQQVKDIIPYTIGTFVKEGQEYFSFDSSALTFVLINAVQELSAKVDALNTQILNPSDTQFYSPIVETDLLKSPSIQTESLTTKTITSQNLDSINASISGEITAASISARIAKLEKIDAKEIKADFIQTKTLKAEKIEGLKDSLNDFINESTFSALLAQSEPVQEASPSSYLALDTSYPFLESDALFVSEYLGVMGQATITELNVTGSITNQEGSLSLMAGVLTINDTGNVQLNGNLNISGNLAVAGEISSPKATFGDIMANKAVFYDLQASTATVSGELHTTKLYLTASEATPSAGFLSTSITTSSSTGTGEIRAGTQEFKVETTALTEDSQIYITPTSPTNNQTLYISQKDEDQFTVSVDNLPASDITFNWFVIN